MGLTRVAVELSRMNSPEENGQYTYNAEFLVDTGAMDSMAPASELRKVGIQPVGKRIYEFANGEVQEYEHGIAQVSFMGKVTCTDIIFGPDDTEPILGVITLENANFLVDPKNQTLTKLLARPLKQMRQNSFV
jgi:clan AA aspartic protease